MRCRDCLSNRWRSHGRLTISSDAEGLVTELRTKPGKDIALFGGGELFRILFAAGLVDRVEVSLIPVLLGGGIPLIPSPAGRATLNCENSASTRKPARSGSSTTSCEPDRIQQPFLKQQRFRRSSFARTCSRLYQCPFDREGKRRVRSGLWRFGVPGVARRAISDRECSDNHDCLQFPKRRKAKAERSPVV